MDDAPPDTLCSMGTIVTARGLVPVDRGSVVRELDARERQRST